MPITFLDLPQVINLTLDVQNSGIQALSNYPITKNEFKIFSGMTTTVSLFVKDVDRQIVTLQPGQTLTLNLVDYNSNMLLLTRDLVLVDPSQGLFSVTFVPSDSLLWNFGPLTYSVVVNNPDGSQNMLYTDFNYSGTANCYFVPGPIPGAAQPVIMNPSDFIITDGWATSPTLPGSVFPGSVQTFAFYLTGFSGPIYIQGSLQAQPQNMADWFQIETVQITQLTTGVQQVTVRTNCTWLRTQVPVYENIMNPNILLPIFTGVVNQIMYKN